MSEYAIYSRPRRKLDVTRRYVIYTHHHYDWSEVGPSFDVKEEAFNYALNADKSYVDVEIIDTDTGEEFFCEEVAWKAVVGVDEALHRTKVYPVGGVPV